MASVEDFWRCYSAIVPSKRHFYEIIRENTPCRLYLDLEFHIKDNPTVNGDALTTDLLQVNTLLVLHNVLACACCDN